MPEYFCHYTSRDNAQRIRSAGILRPGPGGRIYLTDHEYQRGIDAQQLLAIVGKAIEVVCVIPANRVVDTQPEGGRHVERLLLDDVILRSGCGTEWYTESEIDMAGLDWLDLSET